MASVNVDAELVRQGGMLQKEEKLIELSNGCICCTLREDLFTELARLASEGGGKLDHILIESSGISEPLPVAETFTFKDATGASLGDIARLDTLVTVVDGSSFLDELYAADELRARGWQATAEDERTVAQLFCDQLEFANVIIMNKMDLMDDAESARLRAVLRRFNPDAQLIEAADPDIILTQALCDVCAVSYPKVLSTCAKVLAGDEARPRVISIEPTTYEEVLNTILHVGEVCGALPQAQQLVASLHDHDGQHSDRAFSDGRRVHPRRRRSRLQGGHLDTVTPVPLRLVKPLVGSAIDIRKGQTTAEDQPADADR